MKSLARHILTAVLVCAALALTGCSAIRKTAVERLREIEVTSFKVDRITPRGLKAMDLSFYVGIHNPTVKIGLEDVRIRLFYRNVEIGTLVLDPFTIEGREDRIYLLSGSAELSSAASLLQLAGALGGGSADDFTVSVSAVGKGAGIKRGLERTMPLNELIESVKR